MKKWECTVCGYIHEGDQPPDECPQCGADKSKFIEVPSDEIVKADSAPDKPDNTPSSNFLINMMVKFHAHPITVHIPNGVVPISVIFVTLAVFLNLESLSKAAFYNYFFVVLSMPMVLFSGYVDWQKKYDGKMTKLFMIKISCGCVVLCLSVLIVLWMIFNPQVTDTESSSRWSFLLLNYIVLAAAGLAGHFGGKLVFKD